jgi:hypothetical protein
VDIQKRHGHDHDHDHVHRRSSIVIPSSQGGSYVISHDRRSPHDDNKAVVPHVHGHRRRDALGISGTIDIVVRSLWSFMHWPTWLTLISRVQDR